MLAVYQKELASFFRSVTGYLYMAFFLAVCGIFFAAFNLRGGMAEFGYVLGNTTIVLLIAIPMLTMRSLGEEQRQKTDQLLFTSPVSVGSVILGKYFAILTLFALPLLLMLGYPLILSEYGTVLLVQSYSCFLGFFLMGAACIAIGVFVSCLSESQVVAAVGSFAILLTSYFIYGISGLFGATAAATMAGFSGVTVAAALILWAVTRKWKAALSLAVVCEGFLCLLFFLRPEWLEGRFGAFLQIFALFQRYYDFVDGIFDLTHCIYYVGVAAVFLSWTVLAVGKRRHENRSYPMVMGSLLLGIVVLVNLIGGQLPIGLTSFDTSSDGLYSLSPQTEQVVGKLDSPISLYLIAPKGKEDKKLVQLLGKYEGMGNGISVKYVDPVTDPAFVPSFTADKLSDNSVIVAGEERFRLLRNTDLFPVSYDYETGKTDSVFDGEGQITGAIQYVTAKNLARLYTVTGHGEGALSETFLSSLQKEGIAVESLNLTGDMLPEADGGLLLIYDPTSDLSSYERDVLNGYLEQGGRLLLITGASSPTMENLAAVMAGYGARAAEGMVLEGDGNYSIPSYPAFLLPRLLEHETTQPLIDGKALLLLPNAHGIILEESRETVEQTPLLVTSENSYAKRSAVTLQYQKGDVKGPFAAAVLLRESAAHGETKLAWISAASLLDAEIDSMVGGNNSDLVLNILGWMTEQEGSITIRPKSAGGSPLRLTASDATFWSVLLIVVLPCIVAAAGVAVYVRRRSRQ